LTLRVLDPLDPREMAVPGIAPGIAARRVTARLRDLLTDRSA
jgi:hypothetical protein